MVDRKPKTKEPADVVLNRFLEKNGILLATKDLPISKSTDGSITIRPSQPTAVYEEDVKAAQAQAAQAAKVNPPIVNKNGEAKK